MTENSSGRARRRPDAGGRDAAGDDPFAVLGLATRPGLSDDDVRAAWRRIAAATHPDREDGGDPARFGAAAAAYVMLRTGFGRGEALADLGLGGATDHRGRHAHRRRRSADAAARGAGRHRARRPAPGEATAQALGQTTAHGPGQTTAHGPGQTTAHGPGQASAHGPGQTTGKWRPVGLGLRGRLSGRPGKVALQMAGVAVVCVVAVVISGWSPGVVGVLAGVLTWLLATAGRALVRRRSQ